MAGAYSFPLLVELEDNNFPKLKNKLVKYFQSKKANGGDCEVDYENGSRTATLRFRREEDQRNVLKKETHEIGVDASVLRMKVRLPTEEKKTQEAPPDTVQKKFEPIVVQSIAAPPAEKKRRVHASQKFLECHEEKWPSLLNSTSTYTATSHQGPSADVATDNKPSGATAEVPTGAKDDEELCFNYVLGNTDKLNEEFLEMLVVNILKDPDSQSVCQHFTLEVIPYASSAVVSFQKENTDFVTRCLKNRTFINKELSVRPLEVTTQVLAEDIKKPSEDVLRLVLENAGGTVENIVLNQAEQSAIITFKDHKDVQKILKKKLCIRDDEIKVYPFYKSLETALYGKDKPSLKLPASVSETIDESLRRFLSCNQSAATTIRSDLAKHFCKVNFNQSPVCLSPDSSLLQQREAKAIIREWNQTVKSAFAQATSKFKSLPFHPEPEAWHESVDKIRQMSGKEDVVVMPDEAGGVILVAGPVDHVSKLEKACSEVLNEIGRRVHREKSSLTNDIKLSPSTFHILHEDGLKEKLLRVYPELKMSFIKDRSVLTVTGLKDEILAATKVIYDAILTLKHEHLEMDDFVLDLLKGEEPEELSQVLLISDGMNAAFQITPHSVQLLAVSDRDLKNARDHLRKMLICESIDVEDGKVLKMPEWQQLVDKLELENSGTWRKIRIQTGQQVVVSGLRQSVQHVSCELKDFLTQNANVEEVVPANYNVIIEYIKPRISSLGKVVEKVKVSYTEDSICLSGSRADVAKCKNRVEDLVSSVVFENVTVDKPGVRKLFKDEQRRYTASLRSETRCLVRLVDEADDGQDDLANRPKPVYQLQTPDGVDIAVCKADMCSYPVHAVVNSSNANLNLDGGLAAALLKAAGPQLQDQCDRILSSRGQLSPGECVVTDAGGQLHCKKVIHAVGPHYDPKKHPKAVAQLRRAVQGSLEIAEQHKCVSVALPAISRSQGFNLRVCASTIVKAAKEFCDEKYEDNCIESIHFVNNDDAAVQAMEAAVRQEFGNHGVSPSQQSPQTKATKSPLLKQAGTSGSDPNCLGQVQTKEGVDLILMKGNIEKATTEAIVNSVVGKDLNLSQGAVSGAILREAGPNLQQLVKAKNATGAFGEIIVTAGGNLKSKQVFHAVTPHWDKGKGTTEKILSGIFKDCLNQAEDTGLTSLSFPAIGTGNLGFPKDRVASLMLDKILAFSSKKQPKHLKKVMIVLYAGDANTIQVFSDVFRKRFPTATAGKMAPNLPQSQGPFSKVVSSSGMHETKLGNVAIQVVTGDITKENTDVIVNSSNESFSLKSGVSKAILDAAGQAVEAECQTLAAQPNQDMIMTQPGNLKCKKILHLVGQTDPVKIRKVVKGALQMCVKNSYTSVSFPAIGTGQGSVQAGQVADAMLDALIEVLTQNTSGPLKTVRIVIFQPPMLNDFYNSMDQRSKRDETDTKGKKGILASIGSTFISWFTSPAVQPQEEGDFVIDALKVDPACFHICGNSQTDVDLAKTRINQLISSEIQATTISEKAILSFSKEDYNNIADIQKNLGVSIRTVSKDGQVSVTIEGLSRDVLKASTKINKMMWEAKDKEELQKKIELTSTLVEWQYQQQGLQYESFDAKNNYDLEQAKNSKKKTLTVKIKGQNYTVNVPNGSATDSQGRTLQIKRINKLQAEDIPGHWESVTDNSICKVVGIKAGTEEYNEVVNLFKATCPRTVIKIERIQNRGMWKGLLVKKYDMEQRNGHQNNMRRLFHGTCYTTVDWINKYGFNRSYAGKNAACFGNGTYFAVSASYSASDTYSKPNPSGEKFMYLCQVLTGEFTTGRAGLSAPPEKTPGSFQLYDSVVDRLQAPSMFIIFHDAQAYPEYLITFK